MLATTRRKFLSGTAYAFVSFRVYKPVTIIPSGWTTFTPTLTGGNTSVTQQEGDTYTGTGTRAIYISQSTGNDGNHGTFASPVKTLGTGFGLLRDGRPDWLMLAQNDTWTDEFFPRLQISGASATILGDGSVQGLMIIGTYDLGGTQRGVMDPAVPGSSLPILKLNPSINQNGIFAGPAGGSFLAVVGIDWYCYTRDPANAGFNAGTVNLQMGPIEFDCSNYNYFLLENNTFRFGDNNLLLQGNNQTCLNFRLRRNRILDAYATAGHSQGIGCAASNPYFEENFWDHNGWNETVAGGGATIFNRNIYIYAAISPDTAGSGPGTYLGDIIVRSSSSGAQFRSGGTMTRLYGANQGPASGGRLAPSLYAGVGAGSGDTITTLTMSKCVTQGSTAGMSVINANGGIINDCICSLITGTSDQNGITLIGTDPTSTVNNLSATNNIIFSIPSGAIGISDEVPFNTGNTTSPNDVDVNGTNDNPGGLAPHEPFPNPTVDATNWLTSIGKAPATYANFYALMRAQTKSNPILPGQYLTGTDLVNYIRSTGFGRT